MLTQVLYDLQKAIVKETGMKCDIYYCEGKGALAVPSGMPLSVQYLIVAVDDAQIQNAIKELTK